MKCVSYNYSKKNFFQGYQLEVKALRVVQGLDPEFTNQFLIALAQCAADATIDNTVAVQKALSNEAPGASPPPRKSVSSPRGILVLGEVQ